LNGIVDRDVSNRTSFMSQSNSSLSNTQEQQDVWLTRSFQVGRDALLANLQASEKTPEKTALQKAHDAALLAVWYLVFGYTHTAAKMYQRAWTHLEKQPADEMVSNGEERFASPKLIDFSGDDENKIESSITLNLDVSRYGRIKRAKIVSLNGELSEKMQKKAMRKIKALRFRPRLSEGKAVESSNVTYTFPVIM
jgi:hypothetical protein